MATSRARNTKPKSEAVGHTDEKSMDGALIDAAQTYADTANHAPYVSAGSKSKSGDCNDALMRCYNR